MQLETNSKILLNLFAAGLGGALVGKFSGNTQGALYQGAAAAIGGIALPLIHENSSQKPSAASIALYGLLLGGVGYLGHLPWKANLAATAAFMGAQAYISLQQNSPKQSDPEPSPQGSSDQGGVDVGSPKPLGLDGKGEDDDPFDITRLAEQQKGGLENTRMTEALTGGTFGGQEKCIIEFLNEIVVHYKNDQNLLEQILRTPNFPNITPEELQQKSGGVPRNTPLMLLVKMGGEKALAAVEQVLPYYDRKHLFMTSPLGNTPLHVAIASGQFGVAMALMSRADELECLKDLLGAKNKSNKTADQILQEVSVRHKDSNNWYINMDAFYEADLGGEEARKAGAFSKYASVEFMHFRNAFIKEIQKMHLDVNLANLNEYTLQRLWEKGLNDKGKGPESPRETHASGSCSAAGASQPLTFPTPLICVQDQLTLFSEFSTLNDQYVSRFCAGCQPKYAGGSYMPSHSRHTSANVARLVNLGSAAFPSYYPASQTKIGESRAIVSEAPAEGEGDKYGKAREAYYKMVVQTGSRILASATTGYNVQGDELTTYAAVHFLGLAEEIAFEHTDKTVTVKCASEELVPLDESTAGRAGLTRENAPLHYHVKHLEVQFRGEEPYSVIQVVPDFTAVSAPLELAIHYVELLEQLAREHKLNLENPIINCNTGKDRSAQLAIIFGLLKDLRSVTAGKSQEDINRMIDEKDWAQELMDRAFIMENQTTEGGGVTSINQSLLPKVTPELFAKNRGNWIYDSSENPDSNLQRVSEEDKVQINEGIQEALKGYLRRQEKKGA